MTPQSAQCEIMRFLLLSLLLVVTCSSLKISPFLPKELTKRELDIAKTEYKYKVALERRDQLHTGGVKDETTSGPPPGTT